MGSRLALALLLTVALGLTGTEMIRSDSGRPIENETSSSANDPSKLEVHPTPLSNAYSQLRAPAGEFICWRPTEDGGCDLIVVSWFALLADPERFNGQAVQLVGFTRFEFEGNIMWFSREHALEGSTADALWLDVEGLRPAAAQSCDGEYCLIEAVFDAQNRGHLGCCAGTLREIRRLEPRRNRNQSDDGS